MIKRDVITRFKSWIEINFIDCIDSATIGEFCEIFNLTNEEKEILERRFL